MCECSSGPGHFGDQHSRTSSHGRIVRRKALHSLCQRREQKREIGNRMGVVIPESAWLLNSHPTSFQPGRLPIEDTMMNGDHRDTSLHRAPLGLGCRYSQRPTVPSDSDPQWQHSLKPSWNFRAAGCSRGRGTVSVVVLVAVLHRNGVDKGCVRVYTYTQTYTKRF